MVGLLIVILIEQERTIGLLIVILIEQERAIDHLIVIFNRTTKDRWPAITCDVNRASVVGGRPF